MIYTGYFAKYRGPNGVSIAQTQPTKQGLPYFLEERRLCPPMELLSRYKRREIREDEFERIYRNSVLKSLDPKEIGKQLQGKVLLCWEKPGDFCHRYIVADWLFCAGFLVKEWENSDGV